MNATNSKTLMAITYEVVIEVDPDTSMNHATDAVSLQLWDISNEFENMNTVGTTLLMSYEVTR